MSNGNGGDVAAVAMNIVFRALVGVLLLGVGAVGGISFDHEGRLSGLEGNRFTAEDGSTMMERISRVESVPPQWLSDRVRELGDDQDDLRKMVFETNSALVRVTDKLGNVTLKLAELANSLTLHDRSSSHRP